MPKQDTTDTYDLLGKFKAGWFGEKPNTSLTTYESDLDRVLCHAREGTIIVDGSDPRSGFALNESQEEK